MPRWWLWLLTAMTASGWVLAGAAWSLTEMGRYPWAIYGLVRALEVYWPLDLRVLLTSLGAFGLVYVVLLAGFAVGVARCLRPQAVGEA